jgi:hypothetical protein
MGSEINTKFLWGNYADAKGEGKKEKGSWKNL